MSHIRILLTILVLLVTILGVQSALAMPCDVYNQSYTCKSASGKYEFNITLCGFDLKPYAFAFSVGGKALNNAKIEQIWDGITTLGFTLGANKTSESVRRIVIEVDQKTMAGTLIEQNRSTDPAPWKTTASEAIRCQ